MHQQEAIHTDNFQTIYTTGEGLYKEKGSKFIGYAFPANTVEEAMEHVNALKVKYHDARHYCFAYRINPTQPQVRANDDGEPSNSAGMPIYNQLLSADLWNVIVVVVRYFGGTKLGVSGLINAYKEGAVESLKDVKIETEYLTEEVEIEFDYPLMNDVMRLIKELEVTIVEEKMSLKAGYVLGIRKSNHALLMKRLEQIHGVKIHENIS
ncbi:IMPACT family protein [Owenweeksia hongkongensis]|uniref:IMPACT family protein n=1 Tax=Owenweeksia hongkongensis TaxID=253245 RepID=UPI003A93A57D